jgi:hypothetical protein
MTTTARPLDFFDLHRRSLTLIRQRERLVRATPGLRELLEGNEVLREWQEEQNL